MFRSNLLQLAAKLLSDAIASVKLEGNNHFDVQAVLVAEVETDTKCRHTMDAIVGRNHCKNAAATANQFTSKGFPTPLADPRG